jgi:hypothetical protein
MAQRAETAAPPVAPPSAVAPSPVQSQTAKPPITFQTGTGTDAQPGQASLPFRRIAPRPDIACATLPNARAAIVGRYYTNASARPVLSRKLFDQALDSFVANACVSGRNSGPGIIIIVDYAKNSREPRLYRVNLASGEGLDAPILVAHGVGSDPDDDGFADRFSNTPDSLASSLGAARGAEIYYGMNGRSLRLDGLDSTNTMMRYRDIVVHSYETQRRRYFNASHVANRAGRPGVSEGCFVVEPDKRDLVLETLAEGGFLFAGYSGTISYPANTRPAPSNAIISFAPGTGAGPTQLSPQSAQAAVQIAPALPQASGTAGGTSGSLPTGPISPAQAAQRQ